jgi:hypothetical protein
MKTGKRVIYGFTILVLALANLAMARGGIVHNWWAWHWDKSAMNMWVGGTHAQQSREAIADWDQMTDLSLPEGSGTIDIVVYGWNFGDTGWGGLASVDAASWDWHCWWWCRIERATARFNSYWGASNLWWARGVQCQEVGHTFGLDHNWYGGCMGLGYWVGQGNRPSAHDVQDVNARY